MYQQFQVRFQQRFDVKTGQVDIYLGNKIAFKPDSSAVTLDQGEYIDELLKRFDMDKSTPVGTPMVERLSESNRGSTCPKEDQIGRAHV